MINFFNKVMGFIEVYGISNNYYKVIKRIINYWIKKKFRIRLKLIQINFIYLKNSKSIFPIRNEIGFKPTSSNIFKFMISYRQNPKGNLNEILSE